MSGPRHAATAERLAPPVIKFAAPLQLLLHVSLLASVALVVVPWFCGERNLIHSALLTVILLASTVIHEIGHAVTGVARGHVAVIRLTWCGAVTDFGEDEENALHAIICDLSGPLAGALFGWLLWNANPTWPLGAITATYGSWVFWLNLVDLLPIPGFDGWQAYTTLIDKARGRVE